MNSITWVTWITSFAAFLLAIFHISLAYAFRQRLHVLLGLGWGLNIAYLLAENAHFNGTLSDAFPIAVNGIILVFFILADFLLTSRRRYLLFGISFVVLILSFSIIVFPSGQRLLRGSPTAIVSFYVYGHLGLTIIKMKVPQLGLFFRGKAFEPFMAPGAESEAAVERSGIVVSLPSFLADDLVLTMHEGALNGAARAKRFIGSSFCLFSVLQLLYIAKPYIMQSQPALWKSLFVFGMLFKLGTGAGFLMLLRAYQLGRESQIRRSELMEGLAVITASIQHDMAQPLSALNHLIVILKNLASQVRGDQGSSLQKAAYELAASRKKIQGVMSLVVAMRQSPEQFSDKVSLCNLDSVMKKSVENVRLLHEAKQPFIKMDNWRSSLEVIGDESLLVQAFTNIINNGIEARIRFRAGTPPVVELSSSVDRQNNEASISVMDEGGGIDPSLLPYIRKPFISTKNPDQKPNSGLGLYIADRIVTLHRGRLRINNRPGVGTTVIISLPWRYK